MRAGKLIAVAALFWTCVLGWAVLNPAGLPDASSVVYAAAGPGSHLDAKLARVLNSAGFTGKIESKLEARLGRRIKPKLANLGRLLFFDNILGLHEDNSCAGCHSPTNGFGDTQSIARGVQNNGLVGPGRLGPRNQRRSPLVINTAFLSDMMWNGRFKALSGDPFDNDHDPFQFPPPEGVIEFPAGTLEHLLQAQAQMPSTELVEMAGFTDTCVIPSEFCQFDDGSGHSVPPPDGSGSRNEPIREEVLEILNDNPRYVQLFGAIFDDVAHGFPIDFEMVGRAIAEFEFTLTFANAPIDRFARGDRSAMTAAEKRGALVFFDEGRCVMCHAVAGDSNEMFTDFQNRVVGVPQIAPQFGVGKGNVIFDGPKKNEDFGLEQVSRAEADRYKFRTAPLRNIALSPAFFHNGAFTRLEDAIRHHLNVEESARNYDPTRAGVARDLRRRRPGPIEPVLERLDDLLLSPIHLSESEFNDLVEFVRNGLLDRRASSANLCTLVPRSVPSGLPVLTFQGCP